MIDEKRVLEEIADFKICQKSENCDYLTGYISALSAVEGMIAEQPKVGEWIPVSERLPEEETEVIVTRDFLGTNLIPKCRYVEVAEHIGGSWYSNSDEYKCYRSKHTNPIAWMPLPPAYKEEVTE